MTTPTDMRAAHSPTPECYWETCRATATDSWEWRNPDREPPGYRPTGYDDGTVEWIENHPFPTPGPYWIEAEARATPMTRQRTACSSSSTWRLGGA